MDIKEMKEAIDKANDLQYEVAKNLAEQVEEYACAVLPYNFPEFCTLVMKLLDEFKDDCDFDDPYIYPPIKSIVDMYDEVIRTLNVIDVIIHGRRDTQYDEWFEEINKYAGLLRKAEADIGEEAEI